MPDKPDINKLENEIALSGASSRSELENLIQSGLHGPPELHREEKNQFLGEFRERVLKCLTKQQIAETRLYPEIEQALRHPLADKIILAGHLSETHTSKYQELARRLNKLATFRNDPEFQGDIALVVVGRSAVDVDDVYVLSYHEQLLQRGLSEKLISAAGSKVCRSCYDKVCTLAPEEKASYRPFSTMDRLLGTKCPGH
ncbi:YueI family protein [Gorillibacterium massiliense]|uniref:YueI family protein n=1 Tax=Gorillibacterium massiliense TaxID=1280390 RepID=UPI0004BB8243|nr:YueI family protein [Gorillibacterium massiliense]